MGDEIVCDERATRTSAGPLGSLESWERKLLPTPPTPDKKEQQMSTNWVYIVVYPVNLLHGGVEMHLPTTPRYTAFPDILKCGLGKN